ncbi:hypothetical protein [Anaerotignum sp.]|uniref:hypothetical protein n=1 Tax=Anaerotignum sp. TaxID=2039241 RepID=UPI0028AFA73E|nr:hypothetical protein [Anaerotignum sp.]
MGLFDFLKEDSKDKQALRAFVNEVIPEGDKYTFVYSTFEDPIIFTNNFMAYSYVVAFKNGEKKFYIIPVGIDKGRVLGGETMVITKDVVKKVSHSSYTSITTIKFNDDRNDLMYSTTATMISAPGMSASQTSLSQREEHKQYVAFIKGF